MRVKVILVGIGSTLFGLVGISVNLNDLSLCTMLKSEWRQFAGSLGIDCDFTHYTIGALGVFLIMGVVLIILGIKKKSFKSMDDPKPDSNS